MTELSFFFSPFVGGVWVLVVVVGRGRGVGTYTFSPVSLVNVCALIMARTSPPNGVEKALQPAVGRHVSAVFLSGENGAVTHRVSAAAAPSALPQTKAPRCN